MDREFFGLIKFVTEKAHAEEFLSGRLRMSALSVYRTLEEKQQARADREEGLIALLQGPLTIQLGSVVVPLPKEDMVGPATIIANDLDSYRVLCLHALTSRGFTGTTHDEFAKHLQIDDECKKFGEWAVVMRNAWTFVKRVKAATSGLKPEGGFVEYHDRMTFNGHVNREGFHKDVSFAHEREYRLMVQPLVDVPGPYYLDVGDLSDIAAVVRSEDLFGVPKVTSKT